MSDALDPAKCCRDDGSYDFKRREDWGYSHSYSYLSGGFGLEQERFSKKKRREKGKLELDAPALPADAQLVHTIEQVARKVHGYSDPAMFQRHLQEENRRTGGFPFLEKAGTGHAYYRFVRHCLEREVDPRPLAEKAATVLADRELKQANARGNVLAAGSGAPCDKKEAVYAVGELLEVVGIRTKAGYNGCIVCVLCYDRGSERYEVRFEGGRFDSVVVKMKEENLMRTAVELRQVREIQEMPEGEIPNGTSVEICGLQNEASRWMCGQKAVVVQWDLNAERYEVRLLCDNSIKSVRPVNLRPELPEGWEEHFDEHLGRHYYLDSKAQRVTWKHPVVANSRARFGQVRENNAEELEGVEVDENRVRYEVDEEEELEGNFSLQELVRKVEERETRREEAEEQGLDDADSDDGLHRVAKKRKKRKRDAVTVEALQARVAALIEETMVARETMKKDYTLLEGHFIARDMDVSLAQFELDPDGASPALLRTIFELTLGLLEKAASLMTQLRVAKLQVAETMKRLDLLVTLTSPAQLLQVAQWTSALLKTM